MLRRPVLFLALSLVGGNALFGNEYDYVVVGGGTGGNVIATRLAEKGFQVALIEAGGYYEFQSFAAIPAADCLPVGSSPAVQSSIDWGFVTESFPGANNRPIHFARGKTLGGSSALNFMVYHRPTIESMQQWADAVDDQSYTFDEVLPFYKRSTHFTPPNEEYRLANASARYDQSAFEEKGGPLEVSYSNYAMPFSTWMKLGMEAIGIREVQDFNTGSLMGAQFCSSTIRPGDQTRSSSESSFLKSPPDSLDVHANTLAKRIIFDKNKKATGVRIQGPLGVVSTLEASKEVIVSAGAFQSPQLLMVSGIGPADTLNQHGIEVISNLPGVGQNMWDHPFFGPSYRVNVPTLTKMVRDLIYLLCQFLNITLSKRGPLTNPVADFLAWEKIPAQLRSSFSAHTQKALLKFPKDWPEAEYISAAGYIGNLSDLVLDQPWDGFQYASMLGVLVSPTSRGNVTIQSTDTSDLPLINPNWLSTEADQEVAIAMLKRMRQAFRSKAMAPVVIGEEYYPGNQVSSDEQILEFIRSHVMTIFHPACTCKMGTKNDEMAVLDSHARVYGVSGLRVVDASSFPILPPGHPQSTVYMLAEKIADLMSAPNIT